MGFLLRTAFWLGLVYSSMPLQWSSLEGPTTASASAGLVAGALQACAGPQTPSCSATALGVRLAAESAAQTRGRPLFPAAADGPHRQAGFASEDTLTQRDRAAPWRGAGRLARSGWRNDA